MYAKPNTMTQFQLDPHDARRFELEALRVRVAADVATIGLIDLLGMRPQDCAVFLKAAASANALNIALNNDDFLAELGFASGGFCALEFEDLAAQSVKQFPDAAKLFLKLNALSALKRSGA